MTDKPISVREARVALNSQDDERREAVRQELEAIAASEITDIVAWDEHGRVEKAVKRVKVTATQHGQNVEVEMHDKISALRLLAKHHGLLEADPHLNRPTLIGINLKGPEDEPLDDAAD